MLQFEELAQTLKNFAPDLSDLADALGMDAMKKRD